MTVVHTMEVVHGVFDNLKVVMAGAVNLTRSLSKD